MLKIKLIFSIITIIIVAAYGESFGDPEKPTVNGTFVDGETIIISVSYPGEKSTAAPNLWDTADNQSSYDGMSDGEAIPTGSPYPYDDSGASDTTISTLELTAENQRTSNSDRCYTRYPSNQLSRAGHEVSGNLYIAWWFKADQVLQGDNNSSKFLRASEYVGSFSLHTFSWTNHQTYVYDVDSSCFYGGSFEHLCTNNWPDYVPTQNDWELFEAFFDNTNLSYVITADGQEVSSASWDYCSGECDTNFGMVWTIGYSNEGTSPVQANTWIDDVYIDNTFSRVMICDGPTWSTRGHCEIQPATAWSDGSPGSITITVNQGSFENSDTVYLYVVDSANNASPASDFITVGGSSAPQPYSGIVWQ